MKLVLYFILLISGIQALKFKNNGLRRYRHNLRQGDCSFQQPEKQQAEKQQAEKQQTEKQQTEKQQTEKQQTEKQQTEKQQAEQQQVEKQQTEKQQVEKQQVEKQQAEQRNNGGELQTTSKATFYFRVGPDVEGCPTVQSFNDGMSYGPCNGNQGVKYTSESKYWAAIKNASGRCGETITVNYNGKSMNLKVMDECPGCAVDNHVDMGLDALIELTGSKEAACAISTTQPIIKWS
jgi:flagellar motor protein MotB